MKRVVYIALVLSACGSGPRRIAAAPERPSLPEYFELSASGHLLDGIRQVSAGAHHTCAVRADGSVFCWGDNTVGQLGDGTRESVRSPVQVRELPPARRVTAGAGSTCAATEDGAVWCWGANAFGQLGNGEQANIYTRPTRVLGIEGDARPTSSVSSERACAITDTGTLACWGRLSARDVEGRPLFASTSPTAAELDGASAVAIGQAHECVLDAHGRVYCRGYGPRGELGHATTPTFELTLVPGLDRVVSIAAGLHHTCAARADGTLFCWGENARGQLGLLGIGNVVSPTRVDLPVAVRRVVAGAEHTCVLSELGDVLCFGDNQRGQVGDSRESVVPQRIRLSGRAADITAGAHHTCALLTNDQVRCWGDNGLGQLGDGTAGEERAWPVAVLDGTEIGEPELGTLAQLELQ